MADLAVMEIATMIDLRITYSHGVAAAPALPANELHAPKPPSIEFRKPRLTDEIERCTCGRSAAEFDALEAGGSLAAIAAVVASCGARGFCAARELARNAINSGSFI